MAAHSGPQRLWLADDFYIFVGLYARTFFFRQVEVGDWSTVGVGPMDGVLQLSVCCHWAQRARRESTAAARPYCLQCTASFHANVFTCDVLHQTSRLM